jgi:hypothetical protein
MAERVRDRSSDFAWVHDPTGERLRGLCCAGKAARTVPEDHDSP